MKIKLLLLLLISVTSCCSLPEDESFDYVTDSLSGHIDNVEYIQYNKIGDDNEILKNDSDYSAFSIKYYFDENLNVTKQILSEYFYVLDQYDVVYTHIHHNVDGLLSYEESFAGTDTLLSSTHYRYDKFENSISDSTYNAADSLIAYSHRTYDKNNYWTSEKTYFGDGELRREMNRKREGRSCVEIWIDYNEGWKDVFERKDDRKFRPVWIKTTQDNRHVYIGEIKRNKKGLPILTTNCEADIEGFVNQSLEEVVYKYSYKYDDIGNWIRRLKTDQFGDVKDIVERRIKYVTK